MSIKNKITIALLLYALLSMGTIGALIKANNAKKKEISKWATEQSQLLADSWLDGNIQMRILI